MQIKSLFDPDYLEQYDRNNVKNAKGSIVQSQLIGDKKI